jgi:6-phosphogluconolactonase
MSEILRSAVRGKWPCHLGVHPSGRHLYVTNIASGHLAAFPVDTAGRVGGQDANVAHFGAVSHPRDPGPRTHSVAFSPRGDKLLVCNIGTSEVLLCMTEEKDGALSPDRAESVPLQPGDGPRHAAFHPSLPFAYVVNELSSTAGSFPRLSPAHPTSNFWSPRTRNRERW